MPGPLQYNRGGTAVLQGGHCHIFNVPEDVGAPLAAARHGGGVHDVAEGGDVGARAVYGGRRDEDSEIIGVCKKRERRYNMRKEKGRRCLVYQESPGFRSLYTSIRRCTEIDAPASPRAGDAPPLAVWKSRVGNRGKAERVESYDL